MQHDHLDAATIDRIRAVLKPRRERYGLAYVMGQWATLAQSEALPERPDSKEDQEYLDMLLDFGPAKRDRQRKRKTIFREKAPAPAIPDRLKARLDRYHKTRGTSLEAEKAKVTARNSSSNKHAEDKIAAIRRKRARKKATSRPGAPRMDAQREALVVLALVYREFTMRVPTLSNSGTTPFLSFANEAFRAIGLRVPWMDPIDFRHWLSKKLNRRGLKKAEEKAEEELPRGAEALLWGGLSPRPPKKHSLKR